MNLLIAYVEDAAGRNMAEHLVGSGNLPVEPDRVYHTDTYDVVLISTPAISADWLESKYEYDSYVFLSRHSAESGQLALTCHSTGNFEEARFGGNARQVAIPMPSLQKRYMKLLWEARDSFAGFDITLEATHHGPTALSKPTIFVEVGTTPQQWTDKSLCSMVAPVLHEALCGREHYPAAVGFGGTHYPGKFTTEVIEGIYALGTVVPKYALEFLDEDLLYHILERNPDAHTALLDWDSMGKHRRRIVGMLEEYGIKNVRL